MIGHVTDLRRASGLRSRVVWKVRSGKRQARSSRHIKSRDFRCTSLFGYLWPVAHRSDELSVVRRSRLISDSRWLRPHWPQHRTFEISFVRKVQRTMDRAVLHVLALLQ